MAHPYHHAISSVKRWGGEIEDYLPIHRWFDDTKRLHADYRHRALRHHAEGIFECERVFGLTLTLSSGRVIPVRFVGEQHVEEDLGFIPPASEWLARIQPARWMNRANKLADAIVQDLVSDGEHRPEPARDAVADKPATDPVTGGRP